MKSSPTYQLFSHYYDELTYDIPYTLWLDIINHYGVDKKSVLDIGCGTGRLTHQLQFDSVTAMDHSNLMLDVARKNVSPNIDYIQGDMRDFKLDHSFDMVTATVDVLNYCSTPEEVLQVLKGVYNHLNPGGIFIFDIHSVFKMNNDFDDITYSDETEHITYIWHALQGEAPLSVIHDMTFFVEDNADSGLYRKIEETHHQRTYTHMEMLQMISQSGFIIDAAFSDFNRDNPVTEVCERVFYVLKK